MLNYYQILGLNSSASEQEIKKAFKSLAMRFHPDKNPDNPSAEDNFKRINAAYQILSNVITKAQYDRMLGEQNSINTKNTGVYYYQGKKVTSNPKPSVSPQQEARYRAARQKNAKIKAERRAYNKLYSKRATLFVFVLFAYLFILLFSQIQFFTKYHYYSALKAYDSNQPQEALLELEEVISYDEEYSEAYFLIGKILFEDKQIRLSTGFYTKAIESAENLEAKYFLQRGIAYSYLRHNDFAMSDFEQALALNQDEEMLYAVGEGYFRLKNYQKAVETYTIAIAKGYQSGTYLKRGMAYGLGKNTELAQQDFDIVVQNSQNSTQMIQKIADICEFELQLYNVSEYFYDKLLEREKTSKNYFHKAIVQSKQQKNIETIAQLNLAISLDANFDSLYYLRAVNRVHLSQIDEACQDWTVAKKLGYKGKNSTLDFYCK